MGISYDELEDLLVVIQDQQEVIRLLIEKIHLDEGLDDETYHKAIGHVNHTDKTVARMKRRIAAI